MATQTTIRTLLVAASLVTAAVAVAHAAEPDLHRTPVISVVGSEASSRAVNLGVGKAVVIDLPRDVKDVLVADPAITNAVVRNRRAGPTSSASRSARAACSFSTPKGARSQASILRSSAT